MNNSRMEQPQNNEAAAQRQCLFDKLKQSPEYLYIRFLDIDYNYVAENKTKQKQKDKIKQRQRMGSIFGLTTKKKGEIHELQFELSSKTSCTSFSIQDHQLSEADQERVQEQTHLFCYEGEEILNVKLLVSELSGKEKKKARVIEGFCRILITPFVAMPHSRHKVRAQLFEREENKKLKNKVVGVINLEIFFLLKFKAELEIYPFYGSFERSSPVLGETRLACIFTMNGQKRKSIVQQQGGIHPKWHEYALSLSVTNQTQKYSVYEKFKPLEENLMKFKLNSVGHYLKIDIVNFPLLDRDAQLVGTTQIRIENEDFLRMPKYAIEKPKRLNSKWDSNKDETTESRSGNSSKVISLRYMDPVTKAWSEAGTLVVGVRFIFDAQEIRRGVDSEDDD